MQPKKAMAYTWKYLKIAAVLAAFSFVLGTCLFRNDFEPFLFTVKTTLLSGIFLLLNGWGNRYKQARNAHHGQEKL